MCLAVQILDSAQVTPEQRDTVLQLRAEFYSSQRALQQQRWALTAQLQVRLILAAVTTDRLPSCTLNPKLSPYTPPTILRARYHPPGLTWA